MAGPINVKRLGLINVKRLYRLESWVTKTIGWLGIWSLNFGQTGERHLEKVYQGACPRRVEERDSTP